jgi:hypothetical protein
LHAPPAAPNAVTVTWVTPLGTMRLCGELLTPNAQAPALHVPPVPHVVVAARFVQAVLLVPGSQSWQGLLGFTAPTP